MTSSPLSIDHSQQSEHVAFARDSATASKLAETLVAFANAGGGTLLVGLDPRSGKSTGLKDPEATMDRALQAALSTDPPLIIPLPQITEPEDPPVLAVTVPPGLPHVYSYRGKYLVRDGTRNRPLDPRRLRRLMMERGAVSFEALVPDGARLEDLDWKRRKATSLAWAACHPMTPKRPFSSGGAWFKGMAGSCLPMPGCFSSDANRSVGCAPA